MKILFLVNKYTYQTKMSRVRFHGIEALSKITMVQFWGLGWNNYNNNLTVQQNLDNMKEKFDIVIAYKPLELKNFKDIKPIKCIRYNEMWDVNWTLKEIKESGSQLVICHHLNDCEKYQQMNIPNVKFVYIGHSAEKTIFKDYKLDYEYDVLLCGALGNYHYPLRSKYPNILTMLNNKGYKYFHIKHPGYKHTDSLTNKYLIEYAKNINKSKIVLACSSKWKYRLGKYIEIPMCGRAAICGDLPDDKADDYSYVIEVTNSMTQQEIFDKISYYLDNEDKRLEKVQKGIEFAINYTQEHYAEKLLVNIKSFLEDNIIDNSRIYEKDKLLECKLPSGVLLKNKLNMKRRNKELRDYIDIYLSEIKYLPEKQNKYVIDLGPGPGDFLDICRELGFKIKGYDAKLDSIKGMGKDYVNLCAIYAKEKNIPINYCNFEETGFSDIEDNSVSLINSRGSFEQIFSKYLLGIPHYKTHKSDQEWSHSDEMYCRFKSFFLNCSKKLVKNGILFIHFNGTKCNSLHNIISKLIPNTLYIKYSDSRILKLIKI